MEGRFAPKVFEGILRRYVSKFPISFTSVASNFFEFFCWIEIWLDVFSLHLKM
jgi:hypothetical protein